MGRLFLRTSASLGSDGLAGPAAWLTSGALLLAAWLVWAFFAEVSVYETSAAARLEVAARVYPLQSTVPGRVRAVRATLGQEVEAGSVLLELEAEPEVLLLEEERAKHRTLVLRIDATRASLEQDRRALEDGRAATRAAAAQAGARRREAETRARFTLDLAERLEGPAAGTVPKVDVIRARADAERDRASAESSVLEIGRIETEGRARERELEARILRDGGALARLEGELEVSRVAVQRLDHAVEQRRIRAPVAGRVGEWAELTVGQRLQAWTPFGAIVPKGELRAVAELPPAAAVGRVRPGQPARLQFEGFPWAQFGVTPAVVQAAAEEPRGGTIRVELALSPVAGSRIPLQHGLPARVEIEIERVSPATLLLRAAGALWHPPRAEPALGVVAP